MVNAVQQLCPKGSQRSSATELSKCSKGLSVIKLTLNTTLSCQFAVALKIVNGRNIRWKLIKLPPKSLLTWSRRMTIFSLEEMASKVRRTVDAGQRTHPRSSSHNGRLRFILLPCNDRTSLPSRVCRLDNCMRHMEPYKRHCSLLASFEVLLTRLPRDLD